MSGGVPDPAAWREASRAPLADITLQAIRQIVQPIATADAPCRSQHIILAGPGTAIPDVIEQRS